MAAGNYTREGRPGPRQVVGGLALVLLAFGWPAAPAGAQQQQADGVVVQGRAVNVANIMPPVRGTAASTPDNSTPPLVHVDEELGSYLKQAGELIRKGAFDQAIEILQALIQREESGFFAEGGNRFVSMRLKANQLLGTMGPKGLKLYRALYDPQALRLYEEAMASQRPERLLRKLSERYLHTTYGPRSLEALGALYFDRARFSQAATCWRQLLEVGADKAATPTILAKIATAHYLAGEQAAAGRAAAELRKQHGDATAVLGGADQKLVEFLARVWKLPVPRQAGLPTRTWTGWPGLGGVPDGMALMSDCDVVLSPRWRHGGDNITPGEDLLSKLLAGKSMYLTNSQYNRYAGRNIRQVVRLRNGHLYLGSSISGRSQGEVALPPLVHPVVADDQVIVRLEDYVAGYDLLTGQLVWRSVDSLPMVRRLPYLQNYGGVYISGAYRFVGDSGRYALTVGGGRVYTVCDFFPSGNNVAYIRRRNPNAPGLDDGSMMAALSVKDQGRLAWRIGRGLPAGAADVVRNGKYLSAPTYRAGRLYTVSLYLERYYLLCLDAGTGSLVWSAPVAQAPALTRRYGYQLGSDPRLSMGSPPAVADGRVYAVTNSGVVAAFDEETGQPLWGYQYPSQVNNPVSMSIRHVVSSTGRITAHYPSNPLIVSGRYVLCLPADSEYLIALEAPTGRLIWSKGRRNQHDLSAIDRERVLLSGKGLFAFRISDGSGLNAGLENLGVHGRPVVSDQRVFASGDGCIEVMDVKTYRTTKMPLAAADGILGNLVSADGKLVSANMLGVCTYFGYEVARAELTKRIDRTAAEKRPPLLRRRAQLAFDAGRFSEALTDLIDCEAAAKAHGDTETANQLSQLFYRTYVALGNHAATPDKMHEMFLKAVSYATTDQDKAHMQLRLAKYFEKAGQYAKAAELAQEISEKYGDEELVEVEIGPGADDSVRFGPKRRTVPGDRLAGDYIRGLLEKYGRECYAKFDAMADKALTEALAAGNPAAMIAVAKRWPNSQWYDDALFRASEAYYLMAGADEGKADEYLAEARRHLYRVARLDDSPLRFSASVALATIYARGGWVTSARKECEGLRELPGETQVAFADVKGKLADVLEMIEGGKLASSPKPMRQVARISPPLAELFRIKDESVSVLRDQEYRPIRLGSKVAVIKGADALLLDTTSDSAEEATSAWKGLTGIDEAEVKKYAYYPPGMRMVGGLSADGKVLLVADRKTIRGLDLVSAKVLWQQTMEGIGIRSFYAMGTGSGAFVAADRMGTVSCLDIATGKLVWQNKLVGARKYPVGPPRIVGELVAIRNDGGKTVTCFSLAKNGRVVGKWTANQWAECEITDDGLLVLMIDGELSVREVGNMNKPLWTHKYEMGKNPSIIGVSSEMLAVSPSSVSGPVEVRSVSEGRMLSELTIEAVSGMPGVPFSASFDGQDVHVLCGAGISGRRKAAYGRFTSSRGISLQKFSAVDGKRQWKRDLEQNPGMYFPSVLPLVLGKEHVIVMARHYQVGMPYYAYIVNSRTGEVAQKIDLQGKGAAVQNESRRRQGIGAPVITNGRLCVESSEGVTVYGEK